MPEYVCVYEIDITADNPRAAAEQAHEIMIDRQSQPPVFKVIDTVGKQIEVDLSEGDR